MNIISCLYAIFLAFAINILVAQDVFSQKDSLQRESLSQEIQKLNSNYYAMAEDTALLQFQNLLAQVEKPEYSNLKTELLIGLIYCAYYYKNLGVVTKYLDELSVFLVNNRSKLDSATYQLANQSLRYTKGILYYGMHDYKQAIKQFQKNLQYNPLKTGDDSLYYYGTIVYMANSYFFLENFHQSQQYMMMSRNILPKSLTHSGRMDYNYYLALNNVYHGKIYRNLADLEKENFYYKKAEQYYLSALSILKSKDTKYFQNSISINYFELVSLSLKQQDFNKAFAYLDTVEMLFKDSFRQVYRVAYHKSEIYSSQGNYEKALIFSKQALQQFNKKERKGAEMEASLCIEIAKNYQNLKNLKMALKYSHLAINRVLPYFNNEDPYELPEIESVMINPRLLEALQTKGDVFFSMYREQQKTSALKQAQQCYQLVFNLIEQMRNNFQSPEYKSYISEKATALYEKGIEIAHTAYKSEADKDFHLQQIYELMEKNKSRLLLQSVIGTSINEFSGIPDSLIALEKELAGNISFYKDRYTTLMQKKKEGELDEIRMKLTGYQFEYDQLINKIKSHYPKYYNLKYDTEIIPVAVVQKDLLPSEAAISFFQGEKNAYVLGITSNEVVVQKLSLSVEELQDQVEEFLSLITETNASIKKYHSLAYHLYEKLLMPTFGQLNSDVKKIKIIADGAISYLPIETLLFEHKKPIDHYASLPYLLKQYDISYAYSFTTAFYQHLKPEPKKVFSYAGFAPDANSWNLAKHPFYQKNDRLAELKEIENEVENVAAIFKGLTFLNNEATESNFKRYADSSKIIHISSHALLHDQYPQYSGVIFENTEGSEFKKLFSSITDREVDEEDGFLHIHELYNMKLQAELSILSACETGMGSYSKGEGVISLGRAFSYAGCPSVLMSLWKANDQTTHQLMQLFAENIKSGLSKDAALKQAKLDYLQNADRITAQPFYWSAFVLMGNEEPVNFDNTISTEISFWLWGIGLLVIIILLWLSISYFRK